MGRKLLRTFFFCVIGGIVLYGLSLSIDFITSVRFPTAERPVELYANHLRDDLRSTFVSAIDTDHKFPIIFCCDGFNDFNTQ